MQFPKFYAPEKANVKKFLLMRFNTPTPFLVKLSGLVGE